MANDPLPTAPQAGRDRLLAIALRAYRLKDEERIGWVLRGVDRPESVAAHSWGTTLLCLLFAEQAGVVRDRALAIATVHDLAEAETGDIAARADPSDRSLPLVDKARLEADGMERLLGAALDPGSAARPVEETLAGASLGGAVDAAIAEVRALWHDYETTATPEARFVRDMNLLDMALQALAYEEQHRYDASRPLPSRGGHLHLDEFFESAAQRVQGELARQLLAAVEARYRRVRAIDG